MQGLANQIAAFRWDVVIILAENLVQLYQTMLVY